MNLSVNAGDARDAGLIPGSGRSPGGGHNNPLQYSGLENSMECIVHGVAKSQTRLSDFHFTYKHSHNKVLFGHEKEGNLVICDNIVGS